MKKLVAIFDVSKFAKWRTLESRIQNF